MEETGECDALWLYWDEDKRIVEGLESRVSFRRIATDCYKDRKVSRCWAQREDHSEAKFTTETATEWTESQQTYGTAESQSSHDSQQQTEHQLQSFESRFASTIPRQKSDDKKFLPQFPRCREPLIGDEDSCQRLQSEGNSTCGAKSKAQLSLKKVQVSEIEEEVKFEENFHDKDNRGREFLKQNLPFYVEFIIELGT